MLRTTSEIIQELRNIFLSKEKGDEIIPFVGAGLSMSLGIPLWDDLVKCYHRFVNSQIDFGEACINNNNDWPLIADIIFLDSGNNRDLYYDFLDNYIVSRQINYQDLHTKLVSNFDKIITTNYDRAFDDSATDINISFTNIYYPDNLSISQFQGKSIAYLHGHIDKKAVVFRKEEYDLAYNDLTEIKEFLRAVIKEYCVLFIGFSFNDVTLREVIKKIIIEENEKAARANEVYGKVVKNIIKKRLYAILSKADIITELKLQDITGDGFNISQLDVFFNVDNDILSLKEELKFEDIQVALRNNLGSNYEVFTTLYRKIQENKTRVEYFNELGIEIMTYRTEYRAEIAGIIKEITKKDLRHSEDLSKASNISI